VAGPPVLEGARRVGELLGHARDRLVHWVLPGGDGRPAPP